MTGLALQVPVAFRSVLPTARDGAGLARPSTAGLG